MSLSKALLAVGVVLLGVGVKRGYNEYQVRRSYDIVYNSTFDSKDMTPEVLNNYHTLRDWVNGKNDLPDHLVRKYTESIMPHMIETLV